MEKTDYEKLENENFRWFYSSGARLYEGLFSSCVRLCEKGKRARRRIKSREALEKRCKKIKAEFLRSVGGMPEIADSDAEIVSVIDKGGYLLKKVIFESISGMFVTANLYLPKSDKPVPGVVVACGHNRKGKGAQAYINVCVSLVKKGIAAFIFDPSDQGERLGFYDEKTGKETVEWGVFAHSHANVQFLLQGATVAKCFIADIFAAFKALRSFPEVDGKRLGMTGCSGGGTQTAITMLLRPDFVTAYAPCCYLTGWEEFNAGLQAQDGEQIYPGLLRCGFDYADFLLAAFDKDVLILGAKMDFFVIEGLYRTFEEAEKTIAAAGGKMHELYTEDVSHSYAPGFAAKAADFFSGALGAESLKGNEVHVTPPTEEETYCLGGLMSNLSSLYPCDAAAMFEPEKYSLDKAEAFLRKSVYFCRKPLLPVKKIAGEVTSDGIRRRSYIWLSCDKLLNHASVYERASGSPCANVLIFSEAGSCDADKFADLADKALKENKRAIVFDGSLSGKTAPDDIGSGYDYCGCYGTKFEYNNLALCRGDSLMAVRIYEAVNFINLIRNDFPAQNTEIAALGKEVMTVLSALTLCGKDEKVTLFKNRDELFSYRKIVKTRDYDACDVDSYVLYGAFRYFDTDALINTLKEKGIEVNVK
mgnify:FL=1